MKSINMLNYVMMAIPVLLGLAGILDESFYAYALFSLIPLGIFQVGVALTYNSDLKENIHFKIYGFSVILFFFMAFTAGFWWDFAEPYGGIVYCMPPILAIYFTIILHKKQ
ncbi:putative membrane protein [Flavobacterium arsenatis]|uniref:Membrane protein n=1 Tax=Flavobacterium arsenatis TaxID=1484332 RepID=A0ABU1TKF1_9FLAO|nr:hypothetical protein [Flavobacterium arsenatis]MDR6966282.1 putative membrane protein [Flavobacterium arsenatis]